VCVCVCRFMVREGKGEFARTWYDYAVEPGRDFRRLGLRKCRCGSSADDCDFCSSEAKNERRMAPGWKLRRRGTYRKEATNPKFLGSSPRENDFCNSKVKHNRWIGAKTRVVCFIGLITETEATTLKKFVLSSRVSVLVKIVFLCIEN
jgi:hypothetical protein